MTQVHCPDVNTLRALLDDMDSEEGDEVLGHLEHCTQCQDSLQTLAGDSGAWRFTASGLRQAACYEPALLDAMERLTDEDVFGGEGDIVGGDEDLSYLQPTDKPGLLGLLGTYEVQGKIGRGGMGIVLKARDPALERTVALKILAPALATSPSARRRFVREGRAAARIAHDHIVTVHGVQEAGGLPFLIMQHVEGESLQERLDREGSLELSEIIRIAQQAATGLAAAHAQGLIHRDIKPANLLIEVPRSEAEGRVRITDFGLARLADDVQVTQQGMVIGTPEYMAPEQARCEPVDQRADLFSLGSVIYAMCTGRPPFRAATTVAVLRQVCDDTPLPVRSLNPAVPVWLAEMIDRLMRKNPDERFQQAAEVVTLLADFQAHGKEPHIAPIVQAGGNQQRHFIRRWGWLCAAILLALVPPALWLCGLIPANLKNDPPAQRAKADAEGTKDKPAGDQQKDKPPVRPPLPRKLLPPTPEQVRAVAILQRLNARYESDVPGLPVVHVVFERGTEVDDILQDLLPLTEINNLSLQGTRITDVGMKYLAGFRKLHQLYLGQTAITDAGVKELAQCEQLRFLGLENTRLTDAGIKAIANLKNLRYFNVGGTGITDASLKDIGTFDQMGFLCLYSTAVSDAGMKDLQGLTSLHTLLINNTDVSDAGLKELAPLKLLRRIDVKHTAISDAALKAFKEVQPGVKVEVDDDGLPRGQLGWLTALGGVAVVIALAAGVAGLLRRRQNAGKALPAPDQLQSDLPPAVPLPPPLLFRCPTCQHKLRVKSESAGKKVKCPCCGSAVEVPSLQIGLPPIPAVQPKLG
jgi:serine/threonine protein kinase